MYSCIVQSRLNSLLKVTAVYSAVPSKGISVQTRTARGGFSLRFAQVVPSRAEGQAVVNQVTAQPCSI